MSTVEVQTEEQITICPKCQSAEPWGQNSWCPSCGYYPKFAANKQGPITVTRESVEPESEPVEETDESSMPEWLKVLVAGVLLILLTNIGVRAWMYFNGGRRAIFSLVEMLIGLAAFGGANIIAWKECRKSDKRTGIADIVTNPFVIWQPTLERMPDTRKLLWAACWGLTMVIAANLIVGGIKYSGLYTNDWGFEQPKSKNLLANAVSQLQGVAKESDKDLMEELEEYVKQTAAGLPAKPPTVNGYIYGVLPDEHLELGRILVARRRGGLLKHCAVIKGSDIEHDKDGETYTILARQISENLTEQPAVSSMLNATWVKPIVRIKLTFDDIVGDGELVSPQFYSIELANYEKPKDEAKESDQDEAGEQDGNTDRDEGPETGPATEEEEEEEEEEEARDKDGSDEAKRR